MAARAAHTTSSLLAKPSIFEVIAQESLAEDIQPAFKRIIKFLSSCNPERYGWCENWTDEMYLLLNGLLQYNYLKHRFGSFEETFYGLQRVSLKKSDGFILSNKQRCLSLLSLCFLPYLNSKWEKKSEQYSLEITDNDSSLLTCPKNFKEFFVKFYRAFHFAWRSLSLIQYLMYMTGRSQNHSLILRLMKVCLVYKNDDSNEMTIRQLWKSAWKDKSKFPDISAQLIIKTLTFSMEMAAFFLQCVNWYHSSENEQLINSLPIPKPPKCETISTVTMNSDICPVCQKRRKIETALITSGEVFCFKCIKQVIDDSAKCPVTGIPSTINDLVRIYRQ